MPCMPLLFLSLLRFFVAPCLFCCKTEAGERLSCLSITNFEKRGFGVFVGHVYTRRNLEHTRGGFCDFDCFWVFVVLVECQDGRSRGPFHTFFFYLSSGMCGLIFFFSFFFLLFGRVGQ
jgi:hypothetical protein